MNLISGLSVAAVAIPVAAMIILLSVFNGFESLVRSMYSAFDADLTVAPRQGRTFDVSAVDTAALRRVEGVGAVSFVLEQSALLEFGDRQATATIRGVDDAYDAVLPLGENISSGEWRVRRGDLERLVIGQSMAWALNIRTLADADVTLYAVRRGSFSTLLSLDNYTRRTAPVGGIYLLDLDSERTYVLSSLRLAQDLFGYPDRASSLLLRVAPGSDAREVRFEGPTGEVWLVPQSDSCVPYQQLRDWFDELEYAALNGDYEHQNLVIPNEGQSYLEAAAVYCQAYESFHLQATSGSKFCYTYVAVQVREAQEETDFYREQGKIGENTYCFFLTTVFVPENDYALNWSMAGNTGEYTGTDPSVPEGALEYLHCGYITLEEDGWHGEVVGTGF